jgi:hypothetical protein
MFFTYLRRELRRRIRQAIFIALGLALGIGLVITVTAASSGVRDAQATVLHSLYGVGTDITVTQTPTAGSGGPAGFGFRGRVGNQKRPASGTKIDIDNLTSIGQGTLSASSVSWNLQPLADPVKDITRCIGQNIDSDGPLSISRATSGNGSQL